MYALVSMLKSRLENLNLFASPITANNESELQNERISTRVFIITLIISILVLLIYLAQVPVTHTIEIKQPSYEQFLSLTVLYPQTLRCPCDNVAVQQSTFIVLEPRFHQICSSDFISSDWLSHIDSAADLYSSNDFSYTGTLFFQTLGSFCRLANKTISNALQTFYLTSFIMEQAPNEIVFKEQIDAFIQNFQLEMKLSYYQSLDPIRISTDTNTIVSGLFTNIQFLIYINPPYDPDMYTQFREYNNDTCSCQDTSLCVAPSIVRAHVTNSTNSSTFFTIPGLYTGCYLVEAARQSSLECFYSISCITMIEQLLQAPLALSHFPIPLNSSAESQFNITSTIDQILSKAMTEQWEQNVSHSKYFSQCHVSICTYSFTSKFDIVYLVTSLVALIGGLTKILWFFIPRLVKFIRHRISPPPIVETELSQGSIIHRLCTFNYFSKPMSAPSANEIKQQLIATKLFFLLLAVSFIVLISYYAAERVTTFHQIDSPIFEQFTYLQDEQHSNPSLSCPCSTLTSSYKDLIQVNYTLHPVCSSDFVRPYWVEYLDNNAYFYAWDFLAVAPFFFHSLDSYCQVAAHYIDQSLTSFYASLLVTDHALASEIFAEEANAIVNTFKSSATRSFALDLAVISNITQINMLMTSRLSSIAIILIGTYPSYSFLNVYVEHDIPSGNTSVPCFCYPTIECYDPISTYEVIPSLVKLLTIPGLFLGCFPDEGIQYSNLACLFNQSCVEIMSLARHKVNMSAIDINSLNYFGQSSTVGDIMNELFVDRWNYSASYRAFYNRCQPAHCTYTLVEHNSFWLIFTTVFGLIGGLMKVLQIIVPRLVQGVCLLYSKCRQRGHQNNAPRPALPAISFRLLLNRLRQLNLFSSEDPITDDEYEVKGQIISTRIFIILLLLSLIILTLYSAQVRVTKVITITNPTIEQYFWLYDSHNQTLTCPCETIAIPQKTFLTIQPTFHQVCESSFVDPRWALGIKNTNANPENSYDRDFRWVGGSVFVGLASLCQLSMATINDGLSDFNVSSFVTTQVTARNQLLIQGQSLIDLFITTIENAFVNSLQNVRDTTQGNALMSGLRTSISIRALALDPITVQVVTKTKFYNVSCSCHIDPTCIEPMGIYHSTDNIVSYVIPGLFLGCYIIEAILQSNLALLYNQSGIDEVRAEIQFDNYNSVPFNTIALNVSLKSRYDPTTPINTMMQQLMTESWYTNVNYSAYYAQCQPVECKYTYVVQHDVIFIVTTITGLIGGLTTILQLIIPRAVKLIRRCYCNRCRRTQVQPFE